MTLLTHVKDDPIVASVIATSGSARTAKIAALREIKRMFHRNVNVDGNGSANRKQLKKLEEQIDQVRGID